MRRNLLITFIVIFSFTGINAQTTRVLFLGNSYTYVNNLDQMVKDFALAMGDTLEVQRNTPGGYTLGHPDGGHLYNETSLSMIAEGGWDYVVLQDQSQFPTIPFFRDNYSYPAAIELAELIREASPDASPVFFMTWGRKFGGQQCIQDYCSADFVDFFHMQDTLAASYNHMAESVDGLCAPVGNAWGAAISDGDPINLFSADNSHPSLAGTYLAACTFYATLTGNSPEGCTYNAGLDGDIALFLQQKADSVVFSVNTGASLIEEQKVKIYPNPANSNVHIELPKGHNFKRFELKNSIGKTLFCDDIYREQNSLRISVDDLIGGIYFINLISASKVSALKILIAN
ncbi:MAG: hypothetical protein C0593_14410 [Marinilabiliales bacterium]|nr:MAG: hypothetical protein C0593_14410 [Marinilabiliales bacterium]